MRLAAGNLRERACWLVSLRWPACASVFLTVWLAARVFHVLPEPFPLYLVGAWLLVYNFFFFFACRRGWFAGTGRAGRILVLTQVLLDLLSLTLLLYFSDLAHNPFLLFYVFHVVITAILLPGWAPFFVAGLASLLAGGVLLLQYLGWIPVHPLRFSWMASLDPGALYRRDAPYLLGLFLALAATLLFTAYFTSSLSRYAERVCARLRMNERILGIGQLVAGFTHQVSNPLDGLQNCLRRLGKEIGGEPGRRETIRLMENALGRIEKVARRLQEFARPKGPEMGVVDVNRALEGALSLLGGEAERRGVEVRWDKRSAPPAWGDLYSLQEVFFNLFNNALEAMPGGGRLGIRVYFTRPPEEGGEGVVAVEVSDTGEGIPPTVKDRIFEPFFTTKRESGGTGLGLALCRMLLSEMGGRIEAESRPGKGSVFRVFLLEAGDRGKGGRT